MRQLARQVHVSVARVITPYSAFSDGDVLFLTSTETVDVDDEALLGMFFSECVYQAVHSVARYHLQSKAEPVQKGFTNNLALAQTLRRLKKRKQ
tara:strand:- start:216 stop:497 length:282 start_codon:yes stop_codon:yes gene_type:complete